MSKLSYVYSKPKKIEFSLPYSDLSGDRIVVSISGKMQDILIKNTGDTIMIGVEDIDWLRQVLQDIQSLTQLDKLANLVANA